MPAGRTLVRYWAEGPGLTRWQHEPKPYTALTRALRRSGVPAGRTPTLAANIYRIVTSRNPPRDQVVVPPEGSAAPAVVAALSAALLAGASSSTAAAILSRLAGGPTPSISRRIVTELSWTELARDARRTATPRGDTAADRVIREAATHNINRKARYLVAATKRLAPAFASGDPEKLADARRAEGRYWDAHREAERGRKESARRVAEQLRHGETTPDGEVLLGWEAVLDERTSADCRAADGRNFNALARPDIGYPGTVHIGCRCRPTVPRPGAKRVEDVKVDHDD